MKKRMVLFFWLSVLFIITLACTLPSAIPTPTPVIDVDATFTSISLTQFALLTPSTPQEPTALPSATLLPTLISTVAPSVPMVTVSVGTNCRTGPGTNFNYLSALLVGEQAEVVGKYTSANPAYWIIKKGTVTCWLWGQYATVQGDTNSLPEIASPPTPTPTATATETATPVPVGPSLSFSFEGVSHCSAGDDYVTLKLFNNGSVAFESAEIVVSDLDTAKNLYGPAFSNAPFGGISPGCGVGDSSLGVGKTAYLSAFIGSPAPSGHHIRITVTLCSQDNLVGECDIRISDSILP